MNPLLDLVLLGRDRVGGLPGDANDGGQAARFIDAPVVLGVQRPREFMALLTARSDEMEAAAHAFADIASADQYGGDQAAPPAAR